MLKALEPTSRLAAESEACAGDCRASGATEEWPPIPPLRQYQAAAVRDGQQRHRGHRRRLTVAAALETIVCLRCVLNENFCSD